MRKNKSFFHKSNWWKYVLSIFIAILYLVPVYVLFNMSMKNFTDFSSRILPPNYLYFGNYIDALADGKIFLALRNSIIITVSVVLVEVVMGCMAAYPLSRNRGRGSKILMSFVMGVMMIPPMSILVGVYTEMVTLGGINKLWSVVAISSAFGLPLSIFLFKNFITSIPIALDEAAAIDGASVLRTFWSIILPQLKPVTVSVIIMKGVSAWNEYLYPSYMLQKSDTYTLILLIKKYFGSADSSSNLNGAAAVAALCILPVVILYIFLQKYFIQGQVDSAVK